MGKQGKIDIQKTIEDLRPFQQAAAYGAIGGEKARAMAAEKPEFFKEAGRRGGQRFKELMQDENYRADHIRRSRMGKEFGVKLPRTEKPNGR